MLPSGLADQGSFEMRSFRELLPGCTGVSWWCSVVVSRTCDMIEVSWLVFVGTASLLLTTEAWLPINRFTDRPSTGTISCTSSWVRPCSPRARTGSQPSATKDKDDHIHRRWEEILRELNDEKENDVLPLETAEEQVTEGGAKTPETAQSIVQEEHRFARHFSDIESKDGVDGDDEDLMGLASSLLNDEEDSIFLDAETYLQYSGAERGMGIVDRNDEFGASPPPLLSGKEFLEFAVPPDAFYGRNSLEEPSFDDLLRLQRAVSRRRQPTSEEEKKIFEIVFKDEHAYLEQTSDIFREGLTNKTAAEEATKIRRGSQYRRKLLNEINKLEKQIVEFEWMFEGEAQKNNSLLLNYDESFSGTFKNNHGQFDSGNGQNKVMVNDEYQNNEHLSTSSEEDEPGEWVLVEDPSTGESFSWNSITGEMKVDDDR